LKALTNVGALNASASFALFFARQQAAWAAEARRSVCESGGHKWIWSSSSASPRSQHKSTCTKSRRGLPLSLSPKRQRERLCVCVCVCMSIDCARMVHVVEGVVRGGVAGCKCAPPPRESARHVAPSAPPGARANSCVPRAFFGAAQRLALKPTEYLWMPIRFFFDYL
jgi:hypothetical protein